MSRRETAFALARAALRAVEPEGATARALQGIELPRDPFVVAVGKAAHGMARALVRSCPQARGFVFGPGEEPAPGALLAVRGEHPLPRLDADLVSEPLWAAAGALGPDDVAVILLSGGGSAMLERPRAGVTMEALRDETARLLREGTPIEVLNQRRSALSALKAGGLGRRLGAGRVVNVVLSDVPGSGPEVVASGPTVVPRAEWVVAADNGAAVDALVDAGRALGLRLAKRATVLDGEARWAGGQFARDARALLSSWPEFDGVVAGGETTVRVVGDGTGGRNGELVLGAAPVLADHLILSLATDGIDGTSGSAGAWLDGAALRLGTALAGNPELALTDNDSARWHRAAGTLLEWGPTGTNVADVQLLLR